MVSSFPWILKCSLENRIVPAYNFCDNLFRSSNITNKVIKSYPPILSIDPVSMASLFDILRDNGVPEKNIILLARSYSRMIMYMGANREKFKETVAKVREWGFDTSETLFLLGIKLLTCMSRSEWETKPDQYCKWGLSLEEISAAFRKYPWFMALSEKKIMAVMDFFVNKVGWESSFLAQNPYLVSHSLEKRLIPGLRFGNF